VAVDQQILPTALVLAAAVLADFEQELRFL
jgi:hypothetical protein